MTTHSFPGRALAPAPQGAPGRGLRWGSGWGVPEILPGAHRSPPGWGRGGAPAGGRHHPNPRRDPRSSPDPTSPHLTPIPPDQTRSSPDPTSPPSGHHPIPASPRSPIKPRIQPPSRSHPDSAPSPSKPPIRTSLPDAPPHPWSPYHPWPRPHHQALPGFLLRLSPEKEPWDPGLALPIEGWVERGRGLLVGVWQCGEAAEAAAGVMVGRLAPGDSQPSHSWSWCGGGHGWRGCGEAGLGSPSLGIVLGLSGHPAPHPKCSCRFCGAHRPGCPAWQLPPLPGWSPGWTPAPHLAPAMAPAQLCDIAALPRGGVG